LEWVEEIQECKMENSTKENILLTLGALVGVIFIMLTFQQWDNWGYFELFKIGGGIGILNLFCLRTIHKFWIKDDRKI